MVVFLSHTRVQKQKEEGMPFIKYLMWVKHVAGHSTILINKFIKMDISIPSVEIES